MKDSIQVVLVAGATASGKSQFGQGLALQMGGEILNADSQQFYRGLDIGTGKVLPSHQMVPHRLMDICEPGSTMTAMDFAGRADALIKSMIQEGRVPILVGGTGFYIRACLEGLDNLPPRDTKIRRELEEVFQQQGGEALYAKLQSVDPTLAEKVSPRDRSRLIRFLEIYELTRTAPSALLKRGRPETLRYQTHTYWLDPPRETLRIRIGERVRAMIAKGWVEEVRGLKSSGCDPQNWANKPIGYGELSDHLEGKLPLEEAVQTIILRTQQYAKRQQTFFRGLFRLPAYQSHGSILQVM